MWCMQQSYEAGMVMEPWFADEKISMQRWRSPCPKSCIWSVIIWSQQSVYFQNPCFCQMMLSYLLFWRPHLTPAILVGLCHGFFLLWHDAFPFHPWFQAHYFHHLLNSLNGQSFWGGGGGPQKPEFLVSQDRSQKLKYSPSFLLFLKTS